MVTAPSQETREHRENNTVEEQNEQGREAAAIDNPPAAPLAETSDSIAIRRALGEWRNCDVLLEIVAQQHRRTRSEAKRRAWGLVRDYLLQKRSKEIARAGKKLARQDLGNYGALAQKLIDRPPHESPETLMQRLCDSVHGAWSKWQSALTRALETRAVDDLHAFRSATKALRYRTELLYDVGHRHMKAQLKWLADCKKPLASGTTAKCSIRRLPQPSRDRNSC